MTHRHKEYNYIHFNRYIMTKQELFKLNTEEPGKDIFRSIKENWNNVAKPLDSLGDFEEIICSVGAAQASLTPQISPRALVIMCADNGIVEEGVSQSGQEVTLAVARNMGRNMSSACRMASCTGTDVITVDIGINSDEEISGVLNRKVRKGTENFLNKPAMTETDVLQAIDTGIKIVSDCRDKGYRMLATGEMGIGNTTTSTAVIAALLGLDVKDIVTRGAGLDDAGLSRKTAVIEKALKKYGFSGKNTDAQEAFRILMSVGGLDIAGMCGIFIGGALYHIPVVVDGIISAAAALCAKYIVPGTKGYMLASHQGAEAVMDRVFDALEIYPVITGRLALGEGTGAVMLFPLLDMIMQVYEESSSFDDIGVEQYQHF